MSSTTIHISIALAGVSMLSRNADNVLDKHDQVQIHPKVDDPVAGPCLQSKMPLKRELSEAYCHYLVAIKLSRLKRLPNRLFFDRQV
jgi:hypothetical protein